MKLSSPVLKRLIILAAFCVPFFLALATLFYGHLTFWYDPSRDLQAAWNNLQKPTLIGPTSGIPGLFYGPYWIWLLSFGLLFSKDPIIVTFLTATLPYFVVFSFVWFQFKKFFGLKLVIAGWLLFMLGTGLTYATQLWNPYPAPLLTLCVTYLLLLINFKKISKTNLALSLVAGFLLGLVINFHISFGIAFTFGIGLFILATIITDLRHKEGSLIKNFLPKMLLSVCIGFGVLTAFLPTLLFEVRHNFNQIQVLFNTLTHYGAVIQVKGLSKAFILQEFNTTLAEVLHMPNYIALAVLAILLGFFAWQIKKKKITLTEIDKKIMTLLIALFFGIGFIYLTARNAVWEYHFISVEIFYLLLLSFLLSKLVTIHKFFLFWVAGVTAFSFWTIFSSYQHASYFQGQKDVVTTIASDAKDTPYAVAAYTNATYSHEYTYLFRWLVNKDVPADPNLAPQLDVVYLIVPEKQNARTQDFVNYRTPTTTYKTIKTWRFNDDTIILKRVKQAHQ